MPIPPYDILHATGAAKALQSPTVLSRHEVMPQAVLMDTAIVFEHWERLIPLGPAIRLLRDGGATVP